MNDKQKNINPDFLEELMQELESMSGLILWRVKATWANQGREGSSDYIVQARTATEALARAWETEDDADLRTVSIEWLCPIESVLEETT